MNNDESHELNVASESTEAEAGTSYIGSSAGGDDSLVIPESKPSVSKGTVVLFAILMLGAGGFYVMYRQSGPKPASAAVAKEAAAAKKTINTFLSGGDSNIKTMEALIRNTEKVVQQFLRYPSMTQVPLSDLRTNPFRLYEKPTEKTVNVEDVEKKKREEERQAILKAVQGFQVQSIMYSDARRACMINNNLYREGQNIDQFTIEKITPSSVVVKNGPYRFELTMQK